MELTPHKELQKLERLLHTAPPNVEVEVLAEVEHQNKRFPIYGISMGSKDRSRPTLGLFGGVHGLEKIGSHVVINHLKYLFQSLRWDEHFKQLLDSCRLVSIPIINPVGMYFNRRSNGNGIDLMRNAPVESTEVKNNLISGHRIGPWLPWYRGEINQPMETETQVLYEFVKREMFESEFSMALDIHSGFGMVDRLWYPYSRTSQDFPYKNIADNLKHLFQDNLPYHIYKFEPQSSSYLINGDIWDYLFDEHYEKNKDKNIFIPWTLEMGSWLWVRKNPRQILSFSGIFNPIIPHRYNRIMRRHRFLLDFLLKSVHSKKNWLF